MPREVEVRVPDIGDFEDVEVVEVLVVKGDTVSVEDPLVSLESDKATMEIPSPVAGVVTEVGVALGDQVSEGSLLVVVSSESDAVPVESPKPTPQQEGATGAREAAPVDVLPGEPPPSQPPVSTERESRGRLPHASPLVRKVAREWGVDLGATSGTGRQGRVGVEDLQRSVRERLGGGGSLPQPRRVDFARFGEVEEVPLARIRVRSAENLTRSWLNVPHVTQHDEADVTALEAFRKSRAPAAGERGVRLSPLVFVMKAVALALRRHPEMASSLAPDGRHLILKKSCHLGVAVDTENGLIVPVVRDVDRKRLLELAAETAALAETARAGKLQPAQISGACFTISSLGGIGGTAFTPIVNAPEVAVLGVSKLSVKPVWSAGLDLSDDRGGRFEPRLILPLSLSYDHRVIDGAAAVRFTTTLRGILEDPAALLL